ncbi:hypothetical protein SAY86_012319 [Trapa natans]|uniref:ZF-HD dimerization-type domain-containing protein n=1 Tax=Trapa natans TaxID=22666 RepID=A0AAN7LWY2_TRANT|nr:hypothetical protein SAY86_012319 [Trapa natans]
MDISIPTQEESIPVPAPPSSTAVYGGGGGGGGGGGQSHMLHRHHHHHDRPLEDQQHHAVVGYGSRNISNKAVVRYMECMKNHAAAMGGTAMDGCGEFTPSGEEGTIEALTCSACSCHRNFHRKEIQGGSGHDYPLDPWYHHHSPPHLNMVGRKVILGHPANHKNFLASHEATLLYLQGVTNSILLLSSLRSLSSFLPYSFLYPLTVRHHPLGTLIASTAATPHKMILPYSVAGPVKRRVLKVWMHNNKHSLLARNNNGNNQLNIISSTAACNTNTTIDQSLN